MTEIRTNILEITTEEPHYAVAEVLTGLLSFPGTAWNLTISF